MAKNIKKGSIMKIWGGWVLVVVFTTHSYLFTASADVMSSLETIGQSLPVEVDHARAVSRPRSPIDDVFIYFDAALKQREFIWSYRKYEKKAEEYFPGISHNKYPSNILSAQRVLEIIKSAKDTYSFLQAPASQWVNEEIPSFAKDSKNGYIQKVMLPEGAQVLFFGDLHGSIQALIRVLCKLMAEGYLTRDLMLKANTYIVFLGDLVDYGRNGIDTLCTALLLRTINPTQVLLCRGNHEDQELNEEYTKNGFANEIHTRYEDDDHALILDRVYNLYEHLPQAIFLGIQGKPDAGFAQCCHGGIEANATNEIITLLTNPEAFFIKLGDAAYLPESSTSTNLTWGDFTGLEGFNHRDSSRSSYGYIKEYSIDGAQAFMTRLNIRAIFRGHQDSSDCCKFLFRGIEEPCYPYSRDPQIVDSMANLNPLHVNFAQNLLILRDEESIGQGFAIGTLPKNEADNQAHNQWVVAPIFTFSNASAAKVNDSEGCGIVTIGATWEDSLLQVYIATSPLITYRHLLYQNRVSELTFQDITETMHFSNDEIALARENPKNFLESFSAFLHIPLLTRIRSDGTPTIFIANRQGYLDLFYRESGARKEIFRFLSKKFDLALEPGISKDFLPKHRRNHRPRLIHESKQKPPRHPDASFKENRQRLPWYKDHTGRKENKEVPIK